MDINPKTLHSYPLQLAYLTKLRHLQKIVNSEMGPVRRLPRRPPILEGVMAPIEPGPLSHHPTPDFFNTFQISGSVP
jgi:hypothetical protein